MCCLTVHIRHTVELPPPADVEHAPELVSYAISYGGETETFSAVRYIAAEDRAVFASGDPYSLVLNDSLTKVVFNVSAVCAGAGVSIACLNLHTCTRNPDINLCTSTYLTYNPDT